MSETNVRLNKVLKELNISLTRAVEFLATKGIEIEARPPLKLMGKRTIFSLRNLKRISPNASSPKR